MRKEEFTGGDLPANVDRAALAEELAAVAPEARVAHKPQINWTRVCPETGAESIETEPATLVVENLPADVSREQVLALLSEHAPEPPAPSLEERVAALEAKVAALVGK